MLHICHLIFCTGQELLAKKLWKRWTYGYSFLHQSPPPILPVKTLTSNPPPIARAANHFYRPSHNPFVMINISIQRIYYPQKREKTNKKVFFVVALDIITYCPRYKPFFTGHHVIHWHNPPILPQIFY
jgi:hypothetical protein